MEIMKDEISQGESLKTSLPVMIFAANSVGQAEKGIVIIMVHNPANAHYT